MGPQRLARLRGKTGQHPVGTFCASENTKLGVTVERMGGPANHIPSYPGKRPQTVCLRPRGVAAESLKI